MSDATKPQPLSVYLAKEAFTDARDILKDPVVPNHYAIGQPLIGDLYVPVVVPKQPKWARFFEAFLPPKTFGQLSSAGALFAVIHKERLFALTFGTGRFLLKQDCWEERFGLRVALGERIRGWRCRK